MSLKHYRNYRRISLQEVSFADEIAFKWIRNFALAFSIILSLRIVFFFTNSEFWNFGDKFWYYLVFSTLLFYISVSGYSHTIKTGIKVNLLPFDAEDRGIEPHQKAKKQNSSQIETSEIWGDRINSLFEKEALYKKANLTLTELAGYLDSNRSIISKAINQEFHMNFNDFVNEKRAEAVMLKLNERAHEKSTLLGIALDCGFNSKTTFNRAFKKHTGLTPQQFVKKLDE